MKSLLLLIIFTLFSVSCAQLKKSNDLSTISIEDGQKADLNIEEARNNAYGPEYRGTIDKKGEDEGKSLVRSLCIYSTLYSTFGLVEFLKVAEQKKLKFSVFYSNGFGSLISVLYAEKKNTNYLEWKLFDLLKRLKGNKPFSRGWTKIIREFLIAEFRDKELQQLEALVAVPEIRGGVVKMISTGKIVDKVMGAIKLDSPTGTYLKPQSLGFDNNRFGIDKNLSVAFMADNLELKNLAGYSWGIYTNYLSYLKKNTHLYKLIKSDTNQVLDEFSALNDIKNSFNRESERTLDLYLEDERLKNELNSKL